MVKFGKSLILLGLLIENEVWVNSYNIKLKQRLIYNKHILKAHSNNDNYLNNLTKNDFDEIRVSNYDNNEYLNKLSNHGKNKKKVIRKMNL